MPISKPDVRSLFHKAKLITTSSAIIFAASLLNPFSDDLPIKPAEADAATVTLGWYKYVADPLQKVTGFNVYIKGATTTNKYPVSGVTTTQTTVSGLSAGLYDAYMTAVSSTLGESGSSSILKMRCDDYACSEMTTSLSNVLQPSVSFDTFVDSLGQTHVVGVSATGVRPDEVIYPPTPGFILVPNSTKVSTFGYAPLTRQATDGTSLLVDVMDSFGLSGGVSTPIGPFHGPLWKAGQPPDYAYFAQDTDKAGNMVFAFKNPNGTFVRCFLSPTKTINFDIAHPRTLEVGTDYTPRTYSTLNDGSEIVISANELLGMVHIHSWNAAGVKGAIVPLTLPSGAVFNSVAIDPARLKMRIASTDATGKNYVQELNPTTFALVNSPVQIAAIANTLFRIEAGTNGEYTQISDNMTTDVETRVKLDKNNAVLSTTNITQNDKSVVPAHIACARFESLTTIDNKAKLAGMDVWGLPLFYVQLPVATGYALVGPAPAVGNDGTAKFVAASADLRKIKITTVTAGGLINQTVDVPVSSDTTSAFPPEYISHSTDRTGITDLLTTTATNNKYNIRTLSASNAVTKDSSFTLGTDDSGYEPKMIARLDSGAKTVVLVNDLTGAVRFRRWSASGGALTTVALPAPTGQTFMGFVSGPDNLSAATAFKDAKNNVTINNLNPSTYAKAYTATFTSSYATPGRLVPGLGGSSTFVWDGGGYIMTVSLSNTGSQVGNALLCNTGTDRLDTNTMLASQKKLNKQSMFLASEKSRSRHHAKTSNNGRKFMSCAR